MAKPKSIQPTIIPRSTTNLTSNVVKSNDSRTVLDNHINNKDIHVDQNLRDNINYARKDIEKHNENENIHVSIQEKDKWNNKETPQGAQSKVNKVNNSLRLHINDHNSHITKAEKEVFKDKYTKAEIRNLLKHALTGLIFEKSVATRTELDIKYPEPKFNTCVFIRTTKTTVIYNGNEWVDFNALFTPELTTEVDGLMSLIDKEKIDSVEYNANYYIHPDNIDTRHVSDDQIIYWNAKADNIIASTFIDGLMSSEDKEKLNNIELFANFYTHPKTHDPSIIEQDFENRFVSSEQIKNWDNKVEKEYVDKLSNDTLATAKAFTDTKVASILNSSENQLEVLRSLSFELKKDDVVKNFFDKFNSCISNKEFKDHTTNDKIHMDRNDIALLRNVKSLLESGVNPDWDETDSTSSKYIENKPKSLPANGGNADTVGKYKAEDLFNNKSFYDHTIGTPEYTKEQVSITTTEDTLVDKIDTVINQINKGQGYSVLFKSGSYSIEKELVIRASNKIISGIGELSKLVGASIKIIGNNNIIEHISFVNGKDKIVNNTAISIEGNNNTIRYNNISNYRKGILIEGSNNTVINNTLINIKGEAIKITSNINSNYGNIVDMNNITYSTIGVVLISSKNLLTKNHITKNNILNCSSGIILSNTINNNLKTVMNIINENIVMRGNGDSSEYLSTHQTIISEFSSKNIISCNITTGREIIAPYDILSNNVS